MPSHLADYCYGDLARLVASQCGRMVGDAHRAQDAMQETFARVLAKRPSLSSAEDVQRYVRRAARNVCINMLRRDRMSAWASMPMESEPADMTTLIEDLVSDRQLLERLWACSDERNRRVIQLVMDGQSHEAIGRELRCTRRTIYNRLVRIKADAERLGA